MANSLVDYNKTLSVDYIRENWSKGLLRDKVCVWSTLDADFIKDYWCTLNQQQKVDIINNQLAINEQFLRENKDLFDKQEWRWISKWKKLSLSFIREMIDYVDINKFMFTWEHKDINFIREYRDILDWGIISDEINCNLFWEDGSDLVCTNKFIKEFSKELEDWLI